MSVRGELNLLVDFKGNPEASVALLRDALSPLRPYLTHVDERGRLKRGIVTVLISGRRPSDKSLFGGPLCKPDFNSDNDHAQQCRYLFIDGRVKDVTGNADSLLVPLVSIHWRTIQFARLFGRGEKYMKKLSDRAHAQGKQLRIWGAPNSERIWKKMVKSNVDYLSIDDHDRFAIFAKRFRFV